MKTASSTVTRDAGYVLALGALLMVPILVATGFAVDVGSWYARASELQKASDAAALAGVAWLPDTAGAENAARAVLARNGFPDADADGTVDGTDTRIVFTYPGDQQFRVRLVDQDVETYFSGVVLDGMQIRRQAVAESVLPVAMGSPKNFLGTGSDPADAIPDGMAPENFWLAMSGPCASREQGELLAAVSDWNRPSGSFICTGGGVLDAASGPNQTYRSEGYFYSVTVPASMDGQPLNIDAYEARWGCGSVGDSGGGDTNQSMTWSLRAPDANPYIPTDNPSAGLADVTYNAGSCGSGAGWTRMFSVPSATAGTYFIQVTSSRTSLNTTTQGGTNQFSFRASPDASWTHSSACSTDATDGAYYDADCYQVYATEWMGVYANIAVGSLYLAEVGDEHSGKELEIQLWDTGEGAQLLEILDPNGASVPFEWEILDINGGIDAAPNGGWSGTVTQAGGIPCAIPPCSGLDVSGTGTQPGGGTAAAPNPNQSSSKYNDRLIGITIDLPDDITAAYSGKTWWRVRYTTSGSGSSTDRTTWSVEVNGDPVRLIE